jgi:2-haloacid dehalogenase
MEKKTFLNRNEFDTIIFDLGAVLIDWNPRYLYKDIFRTDETIEFFLANICTSEWNVMQDAGRSFKEGTDLLIKKHPEYSSEIFAFYNEWEKMLGGPIHEMVAIFKTLKDEGKYRLLALTNWSEESFPIALESYEFLKWFDGILVSGAEKMKKPDPRIYNLLIERYQVDASKAIFIDDNLSNIDAARKMGITSIHYQKHEEFLVEFKSLIPITL